MKFKGLIFDLDGTAIPNRPDGRPSKRVCFAVERAKRVMKVAVATGRPITNCREILRMLDLDDPCVISGGTQIIEPKTEKTVWEKRLSQNQVKAVMEICWPYPYEILFGDELKGKRAAEKQVKGAERIIYIMVVRMADSDHILSRLEDTKGIKAYAVKSWTEGCVDIHITQAQATKKQALRRWLKLLNLMKEEVIGVGDSNNDLPLFEMVGYKVAMGDASEKLKLRADKVIALVDQDGLAEFIERDLVRRVISEEN